ncbi:holin [Hafnia phage Pocis76]|uniref:Holin n=1 Tax=Hafnia phage Pocis76 TaxID=2831174 RepID=A0A8E7KY33_9CAUD|nr:holin [Hafnia phage Pocis76]
MRDFLNAATSGSGGSAIAGSATGQMTIAIVSALFMIGFGAWGAYLRWKDSKAFQEALDRGDFKEAIRIRGR